MKKYLVIPGNIISKNDGDAHYINARRMMELYGVKPSECFVARKEDDLFGLPAGLIILRPRYDGDYKL